MKAILFVLFAALTTCSAAQQSARSNFLDMFSTLRVAQTPCPAAFEQAFSQPVCYLHGYDDFFDFKERFLALQVSLPRSGPLDSGQSGYWHTVSPGSSTTPGPAFRLNLQLRAGQALSVTYLDAYIVLTFSS